MPTTGVFSGLCLFSVICTALTSPSIEDQTNLMHSGGNRNDVDGLLRQIRSMEKAHSQNKKSTADMMKDVSLLLRKVPDLITSFAERTSIPKPEKTGIQKRSLENLNSEFDPKVFVLAVSNKPGTSREKRSPDLQPLCLVMLRKLKSDPRKRSTPSKSNESLENTNLKELSRNRNLPGDAIRNHLTDKTHMDKVAILDEAYKSLGNVTKLQSLKPGSIRDDLKKPILTLLARRLTDLYDRGRKLMPEDDSQQTAL